MRGLQPRRARDGRPKRCDTPPAISHSQHASAGAGGCRPRSVSPAAAAVTLALLIGGAGFADAATGGAFILGKANKETSTASLSDSKGTPLAVSAPAGRAPLAVNRNVMVKNLNAQYVGGLTATGLAVSGGEGVMAPATSTPLSVPDTVVARTGKLPAGTYYVTATALLDVAAGDHYGACYVAKGSAPGHSYSEGGALQEGEGHRRGHPGRDLLRQRQQRICRGRRGHHRDPGSFLQPPVRNSAPPGT